MIHEKQDEYYAALNAANTSGESTIFETFLLQIIHDALDDIIETQEKHHDVGINVGINVGTNEEKILALLRQDGHLTAKALAMTIGLTQRQVERILSLLKKNGRLLRHGASKNGYWEVIDP